MATVTALRASGRRVAVELDDAPWRTLPVAAVVEAGITVGVELHRERARALVRALRRSRATDAAIRSLARRERSRAELDSALSRAGAREADRHDVLERASSAGLVDDARFAANRARMLVGRGAGNRLILDDLRRHGIDADTARAAISGVEPEANRAERIIDIRGHSLKTLRYLASRGFAEESLEGLIAKLENGALP